MGDYWQITVTLNDFVIISNTTAEYQLQFLESGFYYFPDMTPCNSERSVFSNSTNKNQWNSSSTGNFQIVDSTMFSATTNSHRLSSVRTSDSFVDLTSKFNLFTAHNATSTSIFQKSFGGEWNKNNSLRTFDLT